METATPTKERTMKRLTITPLHIERGQQMRQIVQSDIVRRGYSFEQAVDELAHYLGIESESVKLAIAIANEADSDGELLQVVA